MSTSDNQLIARFLAGDQAAIGDLVKRYQSPIRQFLRRLTAGDQALADDIVQEVFIKMFTGIGSFRRIQPIDVVAHGRLSHLPAPCGIELALRVRR